MAAVWCPDPEDVVKVDAVMSTLRQGDVLGPVALPWIADRAHPLTRQTAALGDSGAGATWSRTNQVAVVSQTCDIVRTCFDPDPKRGSWPFIQVAPVVVLEDPDRSAASRGHSTRFVPLPALGGDLFVDLTVCSTIEKAYLLGLDPPKHGCTTDEQIEIFAAAIARNRSRFAFPDGMDTVLNPLRDRFRSKRNKDSAEGRRIKEVWEIRVRRSVKTPWDGSRGQVRVDLIFITAPSALPALSVDETPQQVSPAIHQWIADHKGIHELAGKIETVRDPVDNSFLWLQLALAWVDLCATDHRVVVISAEVESAATYSLERMRKEPKLELDHLSHY
jgi:hypothetical protein